MIFLIITYTVKRDQIDKFITSAKAYIDDSRKEVENLSFDFGKGKDADTLVFVSRWATDKAYSLHKKTEHFHKFAQLISPMLADNFAPVIVNSLR